MKNDFLMVALEAVKEVADAGYLTSAEMARLGNVRGGK